MAQVLEAVHCPAQAVVVLQDVLKGGQQTTAAASSPGHVTGAARVVLQVSERRRVEGLLSAAQASARRLKTPHHYKLLGVAQSASEEEVRK